MIFSFITGLHYNLTNIYYGYIGTPDKARALKCLVPYIQVYLLVFITGYSRFYEQAAMLFFAGIGLFQTYVAGLLNISSTAKIDFPFIYWEPIAYGALIYADHTHLIENSYVIIGAYIAVVFIVFVKYSLFL